MIDDDTKYLHQIFGGFTGVKTKQQAKEKENIKVVWYNFHPYDNKDPILLTLMNNKRYWNEWSYSILLLKMQNFTYLSLTTPAKNSKLKLKTK